MKNYFIRLFSLISLISALFPFQGNCMYQQNEEMDYSGPSLLIHHGKRLSNINTSNVITLDDLFNELEREDLSSVKKLDLSKNYITDPGIPTIVRFINKKLPNLEVLDLSLNRFSEKITGDFSQLLINNNFKYLDVVGTGGASSIEGIQTLLSELEKKTPFSRGTYEHNQEISNYISKVIWLPEIWLDGENTQRNVPKAHIESHKNYYKKYKK